MGIRNFIESLKKELGEGEPSEGEEDIPRESEGRREEEVAEEKAREIVGVKEGGEAEKSKGGGKKPEEGGKKPKAEKKITFPSLSLKPPKNAPAEGTVLQSSELEEAKEDAKLVTSEEKYAAEIAKQDEEWGEGGSDDYGGGAQEPGGPGRGGGRLSGGESVSSVRMGIEIDKLKAKVTALREMRSISEEKFYKVNEEMGQLKNTIFEIEKNTVDLKKRAEIAASLVEAVQPQNLLKEVKRLEIEIEKVGAVQEKSTTLQEKINDELKDVRARIAVFRGADAIRELNEEMQKELTELKKTEASIEQHADKVEYIYVMFQKKFSKFEPIFQQVSELNAAINKLRADSEKAKVDVKGLASKSELTELENSVKIKSEAMDKFLGGAAKIQAGFEEAKKEAEASLQKTVQDNLDYLKKYVEDTKNAQAETAKGFYEESEGILAKLREYQKSSERETSDLISEVRESIGSSERGLERKLSEIREEWADEKNEIKRLSARVEKLSLASENLSEFSSDLRRIRELERQCAALSGENRRLEEGVERIMRKLVEGVNGEFARIGPQIRKIDSIEGRMEAMRGGVSVPDNERIGGLVSETGRKVEEKLQKVDEALSKVGGIVQGRVREEILAMKLGGADELQALRDEVKSLGEKVEMISRRGESEAGKGSGTSAGAGIAPPHRLFGVEEEMKSTFEAGAEEKKRQAEKSDEEFRIEIHGAIAGREEKGLEFVKRGEEEEIESERKEGKLRISEAGGEAVRGVETLRGDALPLGWESRLDALALGLKKDAKPVAEVSERKEEPPEKISELRVRPPKAEEKTAEAPAQKPPEIKGEKITPQIAVEKDGMVSAPMDGKELEMQRTTPKEKPKFAEVGRAEDLWPVAGGQMPKAREYMPVKEYRPPPRIDSLTPKQYPKIEEEKQVKGSGQWEAYPKRTLEGAGQEAHEAEPVKKAESPVEAEQKIALHWPAPEALHAESFKIGEKWGGFMKKLSGVFGKKNFEEPSPA